MFLECISCLKEEPPDFLFGRGMGHLIVLEYGGGLTTKPFLLDSKLLGYPSSVVEYLI